jgi:hypothetical protein
VEQSTPQRGVKTKGMSNKPRRIHDKEIVGDQARQARVNIMSDSSSLQRQEGGEYPIEETR